MNLFYIREDIDIERIMSEELELQFEKAEKNQLKGYKEPVVGKRKTTYVFALDDGEYSVYFLTKVRNSLDEQMKPFYDKYIKTNVWKRTAFVVAMTYKEYDKKDKTGMTAYKKLCDHVEKASDKSNLPHTTVCLLMQLQLEPVNIILQPKSLPKTKLLEMLKYSDEGCFTVGKFAYDKKITPDEALDRLTIEYQALSVRITTYTTIGRNKLNRK